MAQLATVLFIMIASPADIPNEREQVHQAVTRWNEANTANRNIVLVPLRWETSSVPMLGKHPQALINSQLVEKSDIVVALFGSRLGAVTAESVSGTAEEIEAAQGSGKPVHLYFSEAPHPNDVDPDQLKALAKFKNEMQQRGLYGSFRSPEELTAHVWQAIEHDLVQLDIAGIPGGTTAEKSEVDFLAQPGQESIPKTDSRGRLKHETRRWVELINRGTVDAQSVTVEATSQGVFLAGPDAPTTVHAGQARRFPYMLTMQSDDPVIVVRWEEQGEKREKIFSI